MPWTIGNWCMQRLLFPLLLLGSGAHAQQTSVLFIGNSYTSTNDLPATFRELALSLGDTVHVGISAPGGFTLAEHVGYGPTNDAIGSRPWDHVVLQEQSQWGALVVEQATTTASAAVQLCQTIEANYECTCPVFYMTWGHENGDALNCGNFPSVCTYEGMQSNLREGYLQLATYNDGYVAPVGMAWKAVRDAHPFIDLYQADGSHPTVAGTYLAACVFYCTLFQQPCDGASFASTLPPDTASILRQIASTTVLDSADQWNLDVPNGTSAFWDLVAFTPNTLTLAQQGQGSSYWMVSNGDTSTSAQPTFVFLESGWYTITHIYSDPCGNVDTLTSPPFEVIITDVSEEGGIVPYDVHPCGGSCLEIRGIRGGERFVLSDPRGRVIRAEALTGERTSFSTPPGIYLWTISDRAGRRWNGRIGLW